MKLKNIFIAAALALAALHIFILGWLQVTPAGVVASNLVQLASSLLAAVACLEAARRGSGPSRHYWLLIAAGFVTWSVAQVLWTYHDRVNQSAQESPSPTDIIFFFAFAPFVLALIIDWRPSIKGMDWQRTLDIAQVAIVAISAYLYFFYVPAKWENQEASMNRLLVQVFNLRNLFLTAAFSLRFAMTRSSRMRSLFGRTAAFLAGYSLLTGFTNFSRLKWAGVTGMWYDAFWSLPFLFMVVLAATWEAPEASASEGEWASRSAAARRGLVPAHLLGTAIPLTVLVMSAGIAREQLALASIAMVASFACYSARLAVTQHRQIRDSQALTQTEARFRLLFSSNPHPMWVFDPATFRFLEVNDAAVATYGYSREEFLRMSVLDIRPPEDIPRVVEKIRHTREDGSYGQWRHRRKDGTVMHVAITTQHIQLEDRPAELVIAEDVTQRRLLEEQLRQSQKMEAIGTLAGGVAHDFNNLLTVITGYSKLLLDHPGNDAKVTHQLQQIERAGDRAASLTRQLLAFSRRQVLQPQLLNLNDVILGMVKLLHPLIGEDIELVTRLAAAPALIQADPGQMEQVIMNMAVNAREAMAHGGKLTFETRNSTSEEAATRKRPAEKSGAGVMLVVSDTGSGMDDLTKAHIFEPFFTTKPDTGTGLGLSTVYGIVQQSGGDISVESEPGRGSTFKIYFPFASHGESKKTVEPVAAAISRGHETILVVEDDDGLRELSNKILRMNGYEVLLARRAVEAQETIQNFKGEIALVVTDVIMPGMNGVELAQRLVAERPQMKVLFMSGYTNNAIAQSGVLQAGVAFIQKPFSPAALADKIRQVLDGVPAHRGPEG